jgi:hypothetical protein
MPDILLVYLTVHCLVHKIPPLDRILLLLWLHGLFSLTLASPLDSRTLMDRILSKMNSSEISGSHGGSMKMAVFWVVAPCCLVEVYRRFRGACCLHHQGGSVLIALMRNLWAKGHDEIRLLSITYKEVWWPRCFCRPTCCFWRLLLLNTCSCVMEFGTATNKYKRTQEFCMGLFLRRKLQLSQ